MHRIATLLRIPSWVALLAGLAACADVPPEPVWTKPGASDADREAAIEACIREAEAVETTNAPRREREQVDVRGNRFLRCMQERGWSQAFEQP